jgi:hypothetical protein
MPVGTLFGPGESGNPAGRPKGSLGLNSILRRLLDTAPKYEPDPLVEGKCRDMSTGEKKMLNLVLRAIVDGDTKAIWTS